MNKRYVRANDLLRDSFQLAANIHAAGFRPDFLVGLWRELEATVFFVTHDVSEAVYLGDRVLILSNSPGTILTEEAVPPPDRPSREMRREPEFVNRVFEISSLLEKLEEAAQHA